MVFVRGVTRHTVGAELDNCGVTTPGAFSFTLPGPTNATPGTATTTVTIVPTHAMRGVGGPAA